METNYKPQDFTEINKLHKEIQNLLMKNYLNPLWCLRNSHKDNKAHLLYLIYLIIFCGMISSLVIFLIIKFL